MDPSLGWNGITKATPLKQFPAEEPNRTNPEEVISKLRDNDETLEKVNLNNVPVKEDQVWKDSQNLGRWILPHRVWLQWESDNRTPNNRKISISGWKQLLYKVRYSNPVIKFL